MSIGAKGLYNLLGMSKVFRGPYGHANYEVGACMLQGIRSCWEPRRHKRDTIQSAKACCYIYKC